jgi:hypothetical protein
MERLKLAGLMALSAALIALSAERAEACSVGACWREAFFVPDEGAVVPANAPAFVWSPMRNSSEPGPEAVELVAAHAPEAPIALEASERDHGGYLLSLTAGLEAGATYRLVDTGVCGDDELVGPRVEFTATAAAPLPQELGALVATPEGVGELQLAEGGLCTATVEADRVRLSLVPSAETEPWLDLLQFQTLVNGEVWYRFADETDTYAPGASWVGRGEDRLYRLCQDEAFVREGVGEDRVEVMMRATLPGTDAILETAPITIELDCGGQSAGCAAADSGASFPLALLLGVSFAALIRPRRATAGRAPRA